MHSAEALEQAHLNDSCINVINIYNVINFPFRACKVEEVENLNGIQ